MRAAADARSPFRRFGGNTDAVSAVEFAVILPFMLLLLLGSFDITRAVDVKNRTALLSRTISDLVSQEATITPEELNNIVTVVSRAVLYPYSDSATDLTISVESIKQLADSSVIVDWSFAPADQSNRALTGFIPPDSSLIRTSVAYSHKLQFSGFLLSRIGLDTLVLRSSSYMSPRWGTPVEPSGFPGS